MSIEPPERSYPLGSGPGNACGAGLEPREDSTADLGLAGRAALHHLLAEQRGSGADEDHHPQQLPAKRGDMRPQRPVLRRAGELNADRVGRLSRVSTSGSPAKRVHAIVEADAGRAGTAAVYLAVSVIGGLLAAVLGYVAGRTLA